MNPAPLDIPLPPKAHHLPARLFNSSPIQPRRCRVLLTKIALLLYTGEKFPTNEATTLFFGISKLFQNKDASLRQMVHLIIKELAHSAEDIIMVTSTIMKDTGGGTDAIYRPNAIRALCRIIDVSMPQGSEDIANQIGLYRTKYRTCHENRHCGQEPLRFLCRPHILIPPTPNRTRRCSKMAERDAGSCHGYQILWWILSWILFVLWTPAG